MLRHAYAQLWPWNLIRRRRRGCLAFLHQQQISLHRAMKSNGAYICAPNSHAATCPAQSNDGHTHDRSKANQEGHEIKSTTSQEVLRKASGRKSATMNAVTTYPSHQGQKDAAIREITDERSCQHQHHQENMGYTSLRDGAVELQQALSRPTAHTGHSAQRQLGHMRPQYQKDFTMELKHLSQRKSKKQHDRQVKLEPSSCSILSHTCP